MNLDDLANITNITNGVCTLLSYLPKAIPMVRTITARYGIEIKARDSATEYLSPYLNCKQSKEEKKRCKAILQKHNLPKTVGIMCKSENDICFAPNKMIVDTSLNNLNLASNDGFAKLVISGGFFALTIETIESRFVHPKIIMYGTVIKHKGEIYLLRHPLGGFPNYLAKIDLFINGMIVTLDDGIEVGVYYRSYQT
jgi:hypothetical protein